MMVYELIVAMSVGGVILLISLIIFEIAESTNTSELSAKLVEATKPEELLKIQTSDNKMRKEFPIRAYAALSNDKRTEVRKVLQELVKKKESL